MSLYEFLFGFVPGVDLAFLNFLIPAIGAITSLIGAKKQSSAINRGNDINQRNSERMFQLAEQERQRRDELTRMFLPFLLKNMGVSGPRIGSMMPRYLQPPVQNNNTSPSQYPPIREDYL